MVITKKFKKKKISQGSDINVGCANNGTLNQTGEGELPFDNIPEGTECVQLFNAMHSLLLVSENLSKKMQIMLWPGTRISHGTRDSDVSFSHK